MFIFCVMFTFSFSFSVGALHAKSTLSFREQVVGVFSVMQRHATPLVTQDDTANHAQIDERLRRWNVSLPLQHVIYPDQD